jgi:hypothetical protein
MSLYVINYIVICWGGGGSERARLESYLLGLYKLISDYLPYFEKNKYIFQYHNKKKSLN